MADLQERHELTWGCFESMRFICKGHVLMLDFVFAQIQLSLLWHLKDFLSWCKAGKEITIMLIATTLFHSGKLLVSSFDLLLCKRLV
jgi:hypothetical protein